MYLMDLLGFYEYQILSILGQEAILYDHIKNCKGESDCRAAMFEVDILTTTIEKSVTYQKLGNISIE